MRLSGPRYVGRLAHAEPPRSLLDIGFRKTGGVWLDVCGADSAHTIAVLANANNRSEPVVINGHQMLVECRGHRPSQAG